VSGPFSTPVELRTTLSPSEVAEVVRGSTALPIRIGFWLMAPLGGWVNKNGCRLADVRGWFPFSRQPRTLALRFLEDGRGRTRLVGEFRLGRVSATVYLLVTIAVLVGVSTHALHDQSIVPLLIALLFFGAIAGTMMFDLRSGSRKEDAMLATLQDLLRENEHEQRTTSLDGGVVIRPRHETFDERQARRLS
jgi:hypothetical protein